MKKNTAASKMLTAILTYALIFQPIFNSYAQNSPSNVVAGGGGFSEPNCADEGLVMGQTCVTDEGELAHFKKYKTVKGFLGTNVGNRVRGNYVANRFSKKELQAYYAGQNSGSSGGGRGRGNSGCGTGGCGGNGGGGSGGNVINRPGGGGGYSDDDGRGGRGRGRSPQDDFDLLNQFCGDYENLYENAVNKKKELEDQIAALKIDDLKRAERDAYTRMLTDCRDGCIDLAINPNSACVITDQRQLTEIFSKGDLVKIGGYVDGQTEVVSAIERKNSADPALVCTVLFGKKGCLEQILKDGGIKTNAGIKTCEASADWIVAKGALDDANKKLAQLQANLDVIAGDVKGSNSCKVSSARDLDRAPWKTCYNADNVASSACNVKCLEKNTVDSCADALAKAQILVRKSPRNTDCPTCGQGGGGSRGGGGGVVEGGMDGGGGAYCVYGPCNNKAAQIISAIGGIGVPLGLGLMGMTMQNRSLNACISTYAQQVEVAKAVGLPPQASMCGLAYGMGGMMGMNGMAGMGGMYPGMMGMGAMGMPGMGMMGMNGMGGMGMGMYPGMGLYGGLNLGMGMNPMMGMGGMYPGMGGMGMMGMGMNPMMGVYGGAMGSMQGNMMGVQQQMYNAQMGMQQMAAQNMVLQNSMYSGMGTGMYGMGMNGMGMGMNGMYGMGFNPYQYGSYNPYGMFGAGAGMNFGLNLGLNFGTGYNPYMMYGNGMGMNPGAFYIGQ